MKNKHIQSLMDAHPYEGMTFDDVTLVTQYADFLPHETSVKSKFSRNINLNIPFVELLSKVKPSKAPGLYDCPFPIVTCRKILSTN